MEVFLDFIHQVQPYITEKEKNAVVDYLNSGGWITEFRETQKFEEMIANFVGMKYAIVVSSGTAALYLSLLAAGIGPGDKVLVPNYTMIATPNVVVWTGAEVVLVDVEEDTLCMDIEKASVDASTKAVMYVSINGRSGDMKKVVDFCSRNKLCLIEDACQALGSFHDKKPLGTFGDLGIFSFTPHKIITTGQGGAIVTNEEKLYRSIKKLKDFHREKPATDLHDGIGFNFKFTDLQAALGLEQMKTIDFRISRKREIFRLYDSNLLEIKEIEFPLTNLQYTTPWFIDSLLPSMKVRDRLREYLKGKGIDSRPYYPPISHQKMYSSKYANRDLSVSEDMAVRGLWLPSSIGLSKEKINYICEIVRVFFTDLI
jgi:perosamine synthetase